MCFLQIANVQKLDIIKIAVHIPMLIGWILELIHRENYKLKKKTFFPCNMSFYVCPHNLKRYRPILVLSYPPTTSNTELQNPQLKAFASILAVLRSRF